jgi:hypothetical protein
VLSEHEILELLGRLKSSNEPAFAAQTEALGQWPVLVASGLCLNLQRVAEAEFARHPERISISAGSHDCDGRDTRALADICADYRLVHHVDIGFDQCSLLVAYDTRCLQVLALLCGDDNLNGFSAASAYDFSLSLVDCIEAGSNPTRHPAGFLALEFEESMRCEAGWCLTISAGGISGSLYLGLVGLPPTAVNSPRIVEDTRRLEISLRPETISRCQRSGELAIVFTARASKPLSCSVAPVVELGGASRLRESMVRQSLRLSMADVYVLALEVLGVGDTLTLQCDACSVAPEVIASGQIELADNASLRCLSIDSLPLRDGELLRRGDQLVFVGGDDGKC